MTAVFEEGLNIHLARQQVGERLDRARRLPRGNAGELGVVAPGAEGEEEQRLGPRLGERREQRARLVRIFRVEDRVVRVEPRLSIRELAHDERAPHAQRHEVRVHGEHVVHDVHLVEHPQLGVGLVRRDDELDVA